MTIEASHRFGIEIVCQGGGGSGGQTIQLNADSHADQKHWLVFSLSFSLPNSVVLCCRYDAVLEQIEIANDAVLRAQGLANDGMKNWYEQKLTEQRAAIATLQKGKKMVSCLISCPLPFLLSTSPQRKHYLAMGFHRMHDRLICV
jgi:hypothetical protein